MSQGLILIVDDNPNNLMLLTSILQDAGYEVRVSNSGRRAIQGAELSAPELVLLDVQMPDLDGYDVCRAFKANDALRHIPIIFVSALDDVFDKVRAFELGGVDYVTKPFQAAEVLARVSCQLRLSRLQAELERRNEELERRNEELMASRRETRQVFTALSDILPGTLLADVYMIDEKIGEGGFGVVFRGRRVDLGREVAIKILRPTAGGVSDESIERLRREGVAACRIDHPNAVEVLDFGVTPSGIVYLVMELLRGQSLDKVLARSGALPPRRCVELLVPVCQVLAEAHRQRIVHRDVKPENVFLHRTGRGQVVKIVDFGVAKMFESEYGSSAAELTVDGTVFGTPSYLAPERVKGEPYDGSSDVYSLGVMFYRMLCGVMPIQTTGNPNAYMAALKNVTDTPRPMREVAASVPAELEALAMQALAKEPGARPTAAMFAAALEAWLVRADAATAGARLETGGIA